MGRVLKSSEYTFNKAAKTVTFSSIHTGLELSQIQLITDVTNSTIIYQFNKTGYGGTLVGLVLTLTYDTTGAGFNNSDNLMIIIDDPKDNSQLYSGTLSTTGTTTDVDTTDFQTLSIQLSGTWEGIVIVEGSNNGSDYIPLMVYPVNEFSLVDNINEDGVYTLKVSTKFVRLNVKQLVVGTISALILGKTTSGPDAMDAVSAAMDKTQRMPLLVEEVTGGLKKDSNNALIHSDVPNVVNISGSVPVNTVLYVFDTTGYNSLSVVFTATQGIVTTQMSNDGVNWVGTVPFYTTADVKPGTQISGAQAVLIPCITKFIRLVGGTGGVYSFSATLKNTYTQTPGNSTGLVTTGYGTIPVIGPNGSLNNFTGTGVAGYTAGQFANGTTNVPYPIVVGGRQFPVPGALGGIIRTFLLDSDGRVTVTATDQTKSPTSTSSLQTVSNNFQNGASLQVTDLSQLEGQSVIELLAQVLLELRIANQYLSELPRQLNNGQNNLDDPSQFRAEQSIFAQ